MNERERQAEYAKALYSIGWLDGFSAILRDLVGKKLSDETVAEYGEHVGRVREALHVEGAK